MEKKSRQNKRGQIGLYVIIALVIVGLIVGVVLFRDKIFASSVSAQLVPVYTYYSSCVEQEAKMALDFAGTHGGRVFAKEYVPGSNYAPFSSQMDFLGSQVPYWYYISGNGIVRESVPTKEEMQREIADYIKENLGSCNLDNFYSEGFTIELGDPSVNVQILDNNVLVSVAQKISVSKGEDSAVKQSFDVNLVSGFGKLYNSALQIYALEKKEAFLENYTVDAIRMYAPVDGVEVSCAPKVWKTGEVVDGLKKALEANVNAIKFKGNYYSLNDKKNNYFVVNAINLDKGVSANLLYSGSWPTKVEINGEGVSKQVMVASPVGNQQGLGILGFCYAPYHFIYDVSFPVMITLYNGRDTFQFPVVVVVDKNVPREAGLYNIGNETETVDMCADANNDVQVRVFDVNLNSIASKVSADFSCLDQECPIGESSNGIVNGKIPPCVNGYVNVRAEGYAEKKQLFSSNVESSADIILDREKEMNVQVMVGGKPLEGNAIVSFSGERNYFVTLPEIGKMKISEGLYNVSVYVYGNSTVVIPAGTKRQCYQVQSPGFLGFGSSSRQECTDISIPETKIDNALVGGGKADAYILASDLDKSTMTLYVDSFGKPTSTEQLQENYIIFDSKGVGMDFK
jgi:hypothetical protein